MFLKQIRHAIVLGSALVIPSVALAQPPGMGGPPGGGMGMMIPGMGGGSSGGGMRMMMQNPEMLFGMLSRGADVIDLEKLDPFMKSMAERTLSRIGFTGTTITKDQFGELMKKSAEMAQQGQIPGMGGMPMGGPPGAGMGGDPNEMMNRFSEQRFKQYDKNEDGLLQPNEVPQTLSDEYDRYDTNRDGMIDLNEYKEYAKVQMQARFGGMMPGGFSMGGGDSRGPGDTKDPTREEFKRVVVYRAGNLPKDLPSWFVEMDTNGDKDNQVGLYEWKAAGKKIADFNEYDLNTDGFITIEEYLRYKKMKDQEKKEAADAFAVANGGRPSSSNSYSPSRGGDPRSADSRGGDPRSKGSDSPSSYGPGGDRGPKGGPPGSDRGDRGDRFKGGFPPKGGFGPGSSSTEPPTDSSDRKRPGGKGKN